MKKAPILLAWVIALGLLWWWTPAGMQDAIRFWMLTSFQRAELLLPAFRQVMFGLFFACLGGCAVFLLHTAWLVILRVRQLRRERGE